MNSDNASVTCWDEISLDFPTTSIPVVLAGDGGALIGLRFGPASQHATWLGAAPRDPDDPVLQAAARELRAYAAGTTETFDVPVQFGGSPFQHAVWAALRDIPYGATTTYGAIAAQLGRSGQAARAVGAAVGANPIGIIIPCHRVIGADGSLTGFGGGIDAKAALLAREGVTAL
jgi:methylated-DNA-[protein]-cysteine S-methyltransferase